jgi:parallel beta-helix repeat protein
MILNKNKIIIFVIILMMPIIIGACNFAIPKDTDLQDTPFPDVPMPSGINDSKLFNDANDSDYDNDDNDVDEDVFETAHEEYDTFANTGTRLNLENEKITDDAIYKTAYYSANGDEWQSLNLQGEAYENELWIKDEATFILPSALSDEGEHYIIFYSCYKEQENNEYEWNCHGSQKEPRGYWQLKIIEVEQTQTPPSGGGESTPQPSEEPNEFEDTDKPDELEEPDEEEIPLGCDCADDYYCANDVCLLIVPENTYFVATNGNDEWQGNFTHPWATFQKAVNIMQPGDITYFRGGVYDQTNTITIAYHVGKSGTEAKPIRYFNYPGETPIFDGTNRESSSNTFYCLKIQDKRYIYFKGLHFTNFLQLEEGPEVHCIYDQSSNDITYENMVVHNIGGVAFHTHDSYGISYINCDAYDCSDPLTPTTPSGAGGPGNNGAGFRFTSFKIFNSSYAPISYYGCRAWNASDDGFHGQYAGLVIFDHSWSMANGYLPRGGGSGFKVGWFDHDIEPLTRIVKHCISANNKVRGFHENNADSGRPNMHIYNNFAYNNTDGFVSWDYALYPENQNIYRNNIGYANTRIDGYASLGYVHDHNSWDLPFSNYHPYKNPPIVSDDDFISLDWTQLFLPRKPDGSLPDITFGKLAPGSIFIDQGVDVGIPYQGNAPDIGWHESPYTAPTATHIDRCVVLSKPNSAYKLTTDVTSTGTCFSFVAENITLDCDSHTITYGVSGDASANGININKLGTTIKNCIINDGDPQNTNTGREPIYVVRTSHAHLESNTVTSNTQRGIYLYQSSNNTLIKNSATSGSAVAIMLINAHNNIFEENYGESNTNAGLQVFASNNNIFTNNIQKSNNGRAIYISSSSTGNEFTKETAIGGTYGIDITGSSNNNLFKDCEEITGGTQNIRISADSQDNEFINCSN